MSTKAGDRYKDDVGQSDWQDMSRQAVGCGRGSTAIKTTTVSSCRIGVNVYKYIVPIIEQIGKRDTAGRAT